MKNLFLSDKTSIVKKQFKEFQNQSCQTTQRFKLDWKDKLLCFNDNTEITEFDSHYIYHTAWAARILKRQNTESHIDISSILYFNAILSAFIPVEFYDFRPANIRLDGLKCKKADLLSLPFDNNSVQSLSCMHTIEHVGLGRYGDKLDYNGDIKAILELKRVLAVDGDLLFVVPVGCPRIFFNAHRIYSFDQIIELFSELTLKEFSLIPDNANVVGMIKNATKELADKQNYACGCFWFKK